MGLTANELRAFLEHRTRQRAEARENAAFSGYCAGAAFALAWKGELGDFRDFYFVPSEEPPKKEYTSEEYISRYESWQ
jgi:hypothetical protein